jgi:phosphatidylserine decarboxylase
MAYLVFIFNGNFYIVRLYIIPMFLEVSIIVVAIVLAFIIFWKFYFLRDPERTIPEGDNIVSPADGKVIAVLPVHSDMLKMEKGMFGKVETLAQDVKNARYLISIFMSPMDVHVQRAPFNGRVAKIQYKKGKFVKADSIRALSNESNEILLEDVDSIKVIQIAGFVARRIECWVKKGQHVVKGERIGRINLGSQVSVIVPKNVKLRVKEGQRVTAGQTIIAEFTG